jgi:hypothetical protein
MHWQQRDPVIMADLAHVMHDEQITMAADSAIFCDLPLQDFSTKSSSDSHRALEKCPRFKFIM